MDSYGDETTRGTARLAGTDQRSPRGQFPRDRLAPGGDQRVEAAPVRALLLDARGERCPFQYLAGQGFRRYLGFHVADGQAVFRCPDGPCAGRGHVGPGPGPGQLFDGLWPLAGGLRHRPFLHGRGTGTGPAADDCPAGGRRHVRHERPVAAPGASAPPRGHHKCHGCRLPRLPAPSGRQRVWFPFPDAPFPGPDAGRSGAGQHHRRARRRGGRGRRLRCRPDPSRGRGRFGPRLFRRL